MTTQTIYYQGKQVLFITFFLFVLHSDVYGFTCDTPVISVPDTVEVCNLDSGIDSLCLNFNALAVGSTGTWNQDGIIPSFDFSDFALDSVCFDGIQAGCYPFIFITNTAVLPCVDTMATMIVCVKACPCPSPATLPLNPICNNSSLNLQLAELTLDPGTWSIESGPSGQDVAGILTGTIFDAFGILAGEYVVRFTLDNPGGPLCELFSEQTITVFEAPNVTAVNGVMCNIDGQSDPSVLDLYTLINVDASDGGSWAQIGTPMVNITGADGSIIMSSDLSIFPETLIFEYTSGIEAGSPCPPTVITVEVLVRDCNCPIISVATASLCNDGNMLDLNSLLTNVDNLSGTWTTDGNLVGASIFDATGLSSGIYNITFTLDTVPDPNCEVAFSNVITVNEDPIAISFGGPNPCNVDIGTGSTTVNLYDWLASDYSSGSWEQIGGDPLFLPDDGVDMAIVDFAGQDIGESFTFAFITNSAQDPCLNKSVDIVITVVDCLCPPIELYAPAAINNETGILDMCSLIGNSDPGTFTVLNQDGEDQSANIDSDGCIFDAIGIAPGTYIITYTLDLIVPKACLQSISVNLDVIELVSVSTISKENIQFFPNPTNNMLSIKSDYEITSLKLYTTTGNRIYIPQKIKAENVEIDLSSYPSGIYLLQVNTHKGRWIDKVIRN